MSETNLRIALATVFEKNNPQYTRLLREHQNVILTRIVNYLDELIYDFTVIKELKYSIDEVECDIEELEHDVNRDIDHLSEQLKGERR